MTSQQKGAGFGLERIEENNKVVFGHEGTIDGFSALLIYVPEDALAIAFAANGNQYPKMAIVRSALLASYNQPFEIPAFEVVKVKAEELEKYAGTYASPDAPMTLAIIRPRVQPELSPRQWRPWMLVSRFWSIFTLLE